MHLWKSLLSSCQPSCLQESAYRPITYEEDTSRVCLTFWTSSLPYSPSHLSYQDSQTTKTCLRKSGYHRLSSCSDIFAGCHTCASSSLPVSLFCLLYCINSVPVGNLIEIIIAIIRDMYGFIVVLIFIFFGFALIAVEFDQTQISYGDQLYGTFKILFASYDDGEYNVSQKLFTSLIVFLLNVVLLNLLISIMGGYL